MSENICEEIDELLKVLQAHGVRSAKIGDMSFELGPPPAKASEMHPADLAAAEVRRRREQDELLYLSSGG